VPASTALRSFGIGAIAGLRSLTAPAATFKLRGGKVPLPLAALAAGELIGDKLPITPSRLSPPALGFRMISGAVCGWYLAGALDGDKRLGAACGVAGSLAGAFAGYYARKALVEKAHIPDSLVAVVEDSLAVSAALALTRPAAA
jgi:uncharacterized membrane protein